MGGLKPLTFKQKIMKLSTINVSTYLRLQNYFNVAKMANYEVTAIMVVSEFLAQKAFRRMFDYSQAEEQQIVEGLGDSVIFNAVVDQIHGILSSVRMDLVQQQQIQQIVVDGQRNVINNSNLDHDLFPNGFTSNDDDGTIYFFSDVIPTKILGETRVDICNTPGKVIAKMNFIDGENINTTDFVGNINDDLLPVDLKYHISDFSEKEHLRIFGSEYVDEDGVYSLITLFNPETGANTTYKLADLWDDNLDFWIETSQDEDSDFLHIREYTPWSTLSVEEKEFVYNYLTNNEGIVINLSSDIDEDWEGNEISEQETYQQYLENNIEEETFDDEDYSNRNNYPDEIGDDLDDIDLDDDDTNSYFPNRFETEGNSIFRFSNYFENDESDGLGFVNIANDDDSIYGFMYFNKNQYTHAYDSYGDVMELPSDLENHISTFVDNYLDGLYDDDLDSQEFYGDDDDSMDDENLPMKHTFTSSDGNIYQYSDNVATSGVFEEEEVETCVDIQTGKGSIIGSMFFTDNVFDYSVGPNGDINIPNDLEKTIINFVSGVTSNQNVATSDESEKDTLKRLGITKEQLFTLRNTAEKTRLSLTKPQSTKDRSGKSAKSKVVKFVSFNEEFEKGMVFLEYPHLKGWLAFSMTPKEFFKKVNMRLKK